jgi:excisionase family DNA binding protein
MEKSLLTVWEAADVLRVSRSRVYELLYAEQLDLVKIGRSRRWH